MVHLRGVLYVWHNVHVTTISIDTSLRRLPRFGTIFTRPPKLQCINNNFPGFLETTHTSLCILFLEQYLIGNFNYEAGLQRVESYVLESSTRIVYFSSNPFIDVLLCVNKPRCFLN